MSLISASDAFQERIGSMHQSVRSAGSAGTNDSHSGRRQNSKVNTPLSEQVVGTANKSERIAMTTVESGSSDTSNSSSSGGGGVFIAILTRLYRALKSAMLPALNSIMNTVSVSGSIRGGRGARGVSPSEGRFNSVGPSSAVKVARVVPL